MALSDRRNPVPVLLIATVDYDWRSLYRASIAVLVFAILGVVFPLIILLSTEYPHINGGSVGAFLVTFYAALRLSLIAFHGRMAPLDLTFWIFMVFWMGLAPLAQTLKNEFFWPGLYSPSIQLQAALIVVLAILAYETGRYLHRSSAIRPRRLELLITPARVWLLSLMAAMCAAYAFWRLGGLSRLLVTRMEMDLYLWMAGYFAKADALITISLLRIPPYVALLAAWCLWINRHQLLLNSRSRAFLLGLIMLLIGLNLVANFPVALARYWLGTIVISLVFVSFRKTSISMANWILAFVFFLLIAFPLLFQVRSMESLLDYQKLSMPGIIEHMYHGDYDAYQQLLNTIGYVERHGFSWGHNFLGSVLFWVPRSYWDEKPYGTGQTVAEDISYHYTNLSEPLWSEAYFAFGFVGVVVLLMLYGYFSARLEHLYRTARTPLGVVRIFVPFWMGYQVFFLRGDLMNGIAYSLPVVAFMYFAFLKVRVRPG